MKTLNAELPDKLYEQIKTLVEGGWFSNETDVINEALRRFLETDKPEQALIRSVVLDAGPSILFKYACL